MYCRAKLFIRSLECYFGVYFTRCFATREINTKITLSWAYKPFATTVQTLFSMYYNIDSLILTQGLYVRTLGTSVIENWTWPLFAGYIFKWFSFGGDWEWGENCRWNTKFSICVSTKYSIVNRFVDETVHFLHTSHFQKTGNACGNASDSQAGLPAAQNLS